MKQDLASLSFLTSYVVTDFYCLKFGNIRFCIVIFLWFTIEIFCTNFVDGFIFIPSLYVRICCVSVIVAIELQGKHELCISTSI
jgi:hypothetical protein